MLQGLRAYFSLEAHGTTVQREVVAGITTFVTMSYIIVVNPAILTAAGIPAGPSMVATILTALFGTLLMGFYARRPFAIAPYMGENAFVAFTVVQLLGYSWQSALAALFLAGVLFTLLTVARVRQWLVDGIPPGLRYSFAVGIGLYLTFIGLNQTGLVVLGMEGAPVRIGDIISAAGLTAVFGFLAMATLMILRVRGAILLGILATTAVAFVVGVAQPPAAWVSAPPSLAPIFWKLDFSEFWSVGFLGVVLTLFILAFVDTMGTLIGVSARAGLLDKDGNLAQIERPMLADALATTFAAAVGTTTSGAYLESATGIEAGGGNPARAVGALRPLAAVLCVLPIPLNALTCPQAGCRMVEIGWVGAMRRFLARLLRESLGQDLAEYALLLVLIALAVAAVLPIFSNTLAGVYYNKAEEVECHADPQGDPARACTDERGPRNP